MELATWQDAQDLLQSQVDEYVNDVHAEYVPHRVRDRKVIHDPLNGSHLFEDWEIAILNTPLMQRLRHISQTGLANLVYPSANATRLEHSLGVNISARHLLHSLEGAPGGPRVGRKMEMCVRAAALLHDVGHGPFSHASEQSYGRTDAMRLIIGDDGSPWAGAKPHEVLGALVVRSQWMRRFLQDVLPEHYSCGELDPEVIGSMIAGQPHPRSQAYLFQIVNGPFDADKLDYIRRDSHATGLEMALEIERLCHTLRCRYEGGGRKGRRAMMPTSSGVHCIEQILFNKMLLTSSLYHHHKVRASECVLRGVFDASQASGGFASTAGTALKSPVDYLRITDADVIAHRGVTDIVSRTIGRIACRVLPKRALIISRETTVGQGADPVRYGEFLALMEDVGEQDRVKCSILGRMASQGVPCADQEMQIWVDLPKPPAFSEPVKACVLRDNGEIILLDQVFSLTQWLKAYEHYFWKGYVFAPDPIRPQVGQIARAVLSEEYGVEVGSLGVDLCKYL